MSGQKVRFVGIVLALVALLGAVIPAAARAERYAFLVGVRDYAKTELSSLQYALNDIDELAKVLETTGYPKDNIVVMTVPAATTRGDRYLPLAKNIREELGLLLESIEADDTLVVALAGHGVQFKGDAGAYFCPMGTRLADRSTLIALDEIFRALEKSPARSKLLLVDACRNDPRTELSRSTARVELEAVGRPAVGKLPTSIAALYSCTEGQEAYEDPELKHGVFFYYVIEALRGAADVDMDKQVSIDELKLHTTKRVQSRVRVVLGKAQTPQYITRGQGEEPLVTLGPRGVEPPATVTPAPQPPEASPINRIVLVGDELNALDVEGGVLWRIDVKADFPDGGKVHGSRRARGKFAIIRGSVAALYDENTRKLLALGSIAQSGEIEELQWIVDERVIIAQVNADRYLFDHVDRVVRLLNGTPRPASEAATRFTIDAEGTVRATGENKWELAIGGEFPGKVHASAALADQFAFIKGNTVVVLAAKDGFTKHIKPLPAGGDYTINVREGRYQIRFLPTGKPARTFYLDPTSGELTEPAAALDPVAGKDPTVQIASNGHLVASRDGKVIWSQPIDTLYPGKAWGMAQHKDRVAVARGSKIAVFSLATGERLWEKTMPPSTNFTLQTVDGTFEVRSVLPNRKTRVLQYNPELGTHTETNLFPERDDRDDRS